LTPVAIHSSLFLFGWNVPPMLLVATLLIPCLLLAIKIIGKEIMFSFLLIPIIAIYCFSTEATHLTMFIGLNFILFLFYKVFKNSKSIKSLFLITSVPLIYFGISIFMEVPLSFYINPIFIAILLGFACYLIIHLKIEPIIIFLIMFNFSYSYYFYPSNFVESSKTELEIHDLSDFIFLDSTNNISGLKDSGPLIIETWHEYCSACFQAMIVLSNQQKYFEEKGGEWVYLYVQPYFPDNYNTVFRHRLMNNKRVLIDEDRLYFNNLKMNGAPYFNFYDCDGAYQFSLSGFDMRHKEAYLKFFSKYIDGLDCK
jgi:hypothetical protein